MKHLIKFECILEYKKRKKVIDSKLNFRTHFCLFSLIFNIYYLLRFVIVYQKSLKPTLKTGFEYKITFYLCSVL